MLCEARGSVQLETRCDRTHGGRVRGSVDAGHETKTQTPVQVSWGHRLRLQCISRIQMFVQTGSDSTSVSTVKDQNWRTGSESYLIINLYRLYQLVWTRTSTALSVLHVRVINNNQVQCSSAVKQKHLLLETLNRIRTRPGEQLLAGSCFTPQCGNLQMKIWFQKAVK